MGFLVMFVVGMVLLATTALLAPWLQLLGNYPVEVAGLLLAPRGLGTMIAMMISGRLTNKMDSAVHHGVRRLPAGRSLWRLSEWTPAVNEWTLIDNTMVQGAGVGFIFVPLNVVAFATLEPKLRYEATSFLTLVRSIGMSMGISIFEALITRNTQVEHSVLSVFASPLNRAITAAPAWPMRCRRYAAWRGDAEPDDHLPVPGDRLQQRLLADGDHVGADPADRVLMRKPPREHGDHAVVD